MERGDVVPPLSTPVYVGEEGLARKVENLARDACCWLTLTLSRVGSIQGNLKVYIVRSTQRGPKGGRTRSRVFSVLRHDQRRTYRQPPLILRSIERRLYHGVGRLPPVKAMG